MYGKINNGIVRYLNAKRIKYSGGVIINPSVEQMNAHGIYEVVTIEGDGKSYLKDNVIYHYISKTSEEANI